MYYSASQSNGCRHTLHHPAEKSGLIHLSKNCLTCQHPSIFLALDSFPLSLSMIHANVCARVYGGGHGRVGVWVKYMGLLTLSHTDTNMTCKLGDS